MMIMDTYRTMLFNKLKTDWEREDDVIVSYIREEYKPLFKILNNMSEKVVYVNDDKMEVLKDESRRVR